MTIIDDMSSGSHHVNLLIINIENGVNEGKVTTRNHITRGRALGMTHDERPLVIGQFDLRGQTMRDTAHKCTGHLDATTTFDLSQ